MTYIVENMVKRSPVTSFLYLNTMMLRVTNSDAFLKQPDIWKVTRANIIPLLMFDRLS